MWRPFESEDTLEMERGWLAGILVACGAYGIVFTLFVLSLMQLLRTTTRLNLKSRLPLLVYVCLIFTSGSLFIGSASRMIQLGFIDERLFPGGPGAWHSPLERLEPDAWCAQRPSKSRSSLFRSMSLRM